MSTYAEMQANIKSLLSRSDLDTLITTAIKRAIQTYEREEFYFNERTLSLTVSSGAANYTLSSSFIEMLAPPVVTVNGNRYPLGQLSKAEIDDMDVSTTHTGQPCAFALWNRQFRPYPAPDSTYVAQLNFTTRLSTLSAGADSNAWTTDAEELIESRALWWLHTFKTRNQLLAQASKAAELEALTVLKRQTTGQKSTGRIKGSSF